MHKITFGMPSSDGFTDAHGNSGISLTLTDDELESLQDAITEEMKWFRYKGQAINMDACTIIDGLPIIS